MLYGPTTRMPAREAPADSGVQQGSAPRMASIVIFYS